MKVRLLGICVALIAVSICGDGYAKSTPKPAAMQPKAKLGAPAMPKAIAPSIGQSSLSGTMPKTATPVVSNAAATMPASGSMGAGPASTGTSAPNMPAMSTAATMTTDNNYVYVLQGCTLYKFAKSDVSSCGTPFPSACGSGPTPACGTCGQISYIPGFAGACISSTTCNPCPIGSGPSQTTIQCNPECLQPCPAPCPTTCPPPCPTTNCDPCAPSSSSNCDPCAPPCPQPTTSCVTVVTPASMGAGPCAVCPPVASVSQCAQNTVCCLQTLCGAEADKAYLQALMNLNLQVLAMSDASAQYLGTTSLQNYATNSIADSKNRINKSTKWLKTKFCLAVTACPPSSGVDICATPSGKAFDDAYKSQLVQLYVDEISISQVEMERGLDCQVKTLAAEVIRDNQARIMRMKRCSICSI